MTDSQKVDAFIASQTKWKEKFLQFRAIFQKTELKEEVKWGKPTYTLDGKLVVAIADFKNHMALWFHQGVFLDDKQNKLVNAQEAKALRQWRFEEKDEIVPQLVLAYINEAIANCKAGKEVKPAMKKDVAIPECFKNAMAKDNTLEESYNKLTPGRQREYAEHIGEAKRELTQKNRIEKCSERIKKGIGLNENYKND